MKRRRWRKKWKINQNWIFIPLLCCGWIISCPTCGLRFIDKASTHVFPIFERCSPHAYIIIIYRLFDCHCLSLLIYFTLNSLSEWMCPERPFWLEICHNNCASCSIEFSSIRSATEFLINQPSKACKAMLSRTCCLEDAIGEHSGCRSFSPHNVVKATFEF